VVIEDVAVVDQSTPNDVDRETRAERRGAAARHIAFAADCI
jgi:hypothetical protein